jgi:hypothetical protein
VPPGERPQRVCTVLFNGSWTRVTMARSLFEACRNAWDWFQDPFWKGPRPTPDTVFSVRVVGREEWPVYRVRVQSFLAPHTLERSMPE